MKIGKIRRIWAITLLLRELLGVLLQIEWPDYYASAYPLDLRHDLKIISYLKYARSPYTHIIGVYLLCCGRIFM